ncbi:metalloprotease PmbA [Buchnera aphidicola (Mindarus keteleerifoliae)]|uniref:metalloprotease PmbA n=1 Tax=Buchnera aphidicola TaxID=9 RepID=UPI0031B66FF2
MNIFHSTKVEESLFKNRIRTILNLVRNRIDGSEITILKSTGITMNLRFGKIENIEFHNGSSLTVTVFNNNKTGTASSSDLSMNGIKKIIEGAISISKNTNSDPFSSLPEIELLAFKMEKIDLFYPWIFELDKVKNFLKLAEEAAFNFDKRIINTEGISFNACITTKVFGNTHNMIQAYHTSQYSLSSCVVAKDKFDMQRDYEYSYVRDMKEIQNPIWIGKKSAEKALSRLSPIKIKTIKSSVILNPDVAASIFFHFSEAIKGINVYKNSTFLLNYLGKKIFPHWLNIQEDPNLKKGIASKPFDDEGVKTKFQYIIENGILNTWLLNSYSGRRLGKLSTGNSGGIHNWKICSTLKLNFKELLKMMNSGLLITELLGSGTNLITGDFSYGAVGFWVSNGEIQYPVNEITISGNLKNLFLNIEGISNDDIDKRNSIQCGSVLVSNIQISGS